MVSLWKARHISCYWQRFAELAGTHFIKVAGIQGTELAAYTALSSPTRTFTQHKVKEYSLTQVNTHHSSIPLL
ncbi:hypothetical protein RvY_01309 [Ramazzottius varieornatus]|uniref:Uncharacterized protein n=1 Tax=Ramazzottius varieornatus TaxID=947166 RepID=A0A1D1UR56_RAMVA|nr:hypothetical protein RvY_01309 [Ramazzottius varieornatus]